MKFATLLVLLATLLMKGCSSEEHSFEELPPMPTIKKKAKVGGDKADKASEIAIKRHLETEKKRPESVQTFSDGVVIYPNIDISKGKAIVEGLTNLPNGTNLMIDLKKKGVVGESKRVSVTDFQFKTPPFSVKRGRYKLTIVVPFAHTQSKFVQAIIGPKGEKLKGPLVSLDRGRPIIDLEYKVKLPSKGKVVVKKAPKVAPSTKKSPKTVSGVTTKLTRKAQMLKMYMTRAEVISLLGQPTWAVLPKDKGEWALPSPMLTLELHWANGPCAAVVVQFERGNAYKAVGWNEGRTHCVDGDYPANLLPPDKMRCSRSDRKKMCR